MKSLFLILLLLVIITLKNLACSVVYYFNPENGKIYIANNEDYWYDTKTYIQINPAKKNELARLWYGWDNFAQGGINQAGLFFDGAVTPKQEIPNDYGKPKGNLGDEILAFCNTVEEAIDYLDSKKVALTNAHIMFGDSLGNAAVVEWINGKKRIIRIEKNYLIMTNFLLSKPTEGNYPCYRYSSILGRIENLNKEKEIDLVKFGNVLAGAAQTPRKTENGETGGTLYSTFIDVKEMEFVLVYKLDNNSVTKLNLREEFGKGKKQKIKLY